LAAPILTRSGEIDKALVLLSADSEGSWSAADQNYLADIAASLTEIFDYKNEYLTQSEKLTQSNSNLKNILYENEHLNQEINEIRSINMTIEEQIKKLQSDLEKALNELAAIKASHPGEKDRTG
jgi:AAA15 family ATPase/GTPase